jgi:hypothetical protein
MVITHRGRQQRIDAMVWWPGTAPKEHGPGRHVGVWLHYLARSERAADHGLLQDMAARAVIDRRPGEGMTVESVLARVMSPTPFPTDAGLVREFVAQEHLTAGHLRQTYGSLVVLHRDFYEWGVRVGHGPDQQAPSKGASVRSNHLRLTVAYWLLLGQRVTEVAEARVPRAAAKRAKRMALPGRVSVIQLRVIDRPADETAGTSAVEWSHRWRVRGHYRTYWCGPGRTQPRKLWVNDFEKGPRDKPLVVRPRVFDLSR